MSLKGIIEGHINEALNAKEELFVSRYEFCAFCPERVNSAVGEVCNICGCRLQAKLRAEKEVCPVEKW